MQHLDFAKIAKSVGIDAIEYVNQFFKDKAKDAAYLREMNTRAKGEGVTQVLIMVDAEGNLGDPDAAKRQASVENHYKWVDAAKVARRATPFGSTATAVARADEQMKLVADGMRKLVEYADPLGINIVIENHGGLSSNAKWLVQTIKLGESPARRDAAGFRQLPHRRAEPRQLQRKLESYDSYVGVGRDDAAGQGRQREAARLGLQRQPVRHRSAAG